MKKFTFKGVLDGFRQSVQPQQIKQEQEIQEQLKPEQFMLKKTFRHGFPYSPTAFAFDPVQKLIAIGDKSGYLRILGRPGVDAHAKHEGESACAVILVEFIINKGALVTVTADDTLHLWDIRQKTPHIVQSLKFQRERLTSIHVPVGSKWIHAGTEKGNVHIVHVETFALSGYIINWNKAIEVTRTSHPGAVIGLCDNPTDANKLLIAFECGLLVLWDLKARCAEIRWQSAEPVKSISWHYEGKYFVSSHTDGSICSWPCRSVAKPQSFVYPHAKVLKDGSSEKCQPIFKVDLKTSPVGDTITIFSGGMSSEKYVKSNCVTVMVGKTTTVLEMEHTVVDFITLCENPWTCESQEPYAIAVLLQYDLVLIDLLTPGFPCFESPYPMDLHESPVTCCTYLTDCPSDLVPAFYSVGRTTTSKSTGFSEREWPISGGEWAPASCSYSEIVITGHQDGSLKFWDSSAGTLQILYKLKTAKIFEKPKNLNIDDGTDNPLGIQIIYLCSESRNLCVAGAMGQVLLFKFRKVESTSEILVLEVPIIYENYEDIYGNTPECDFIPHQVHKTDSNESEKMDHPLKVKIGPQRKSPGFQCQLVCITMGSNKVYNQITSLCINSCFELMAYGTEYGLVVVDIVQKICLLSVVCPDLYGAHDPFLRNPKSPKRTENREDQNRSPGSDQLNDIRSPESPSIEHILEENEAHSLSFPNQSNSSRSISPETDLNVTKNILQNETSILNKETQPDRRKSMSWKTFNFKRQLSKVNIKIGYNPNNENESMKNNSVFYAPKEGSPEGICDDNIEVGDTALGYNDNIINSSTTIDVNKHDNASKTINKSVPSTCEKQSTYLLKTAVMPTTSKENDVNNSKELGTLIKDVDSINTDSCNKQASNARPCELPLSPSIVSPIKLSRLNLKDKREQRLLSVPNIKYQMRDYRTRPNLHKTDVSPSNIANFTRLEYKIDGSFSRSRSSSISSIDTSSAESVTCLAFIDSYVKRNDALSLYPTLWVGTSFGSVLTLLITMPDHEQRRCQPVLVTINGGPVIRLKGSITSMSFLDAYGSIIPYSFELWRDDSRDLKKDREFLNFL
ncbi:syntaxin-binding protein 5 [Teleopsis dalmanni]|uniref:syntaxin-binding protein 5 n=1 Tax=Teleopsis dalmanni TaxID=139649 RepID=UPI0018CD5F87|nr:syntaxin-binding protein 5 [Teleopsis dalmanni]